MQLQGGIAPAHLGALHARNLGAQHNATARDTHTQGDGKVYTKKWGCLLTTAPFIHEHAYMQVL